MKALDLFSGPGGLSLGMKRAGFEPVACVEKNKDAIATYDAHTPEAEHFHSDIRAIPFEKYRGVVDVIYGGPPCQPFSTGGLQRGIADSRNMFPEFIRALREIRPVAFLAENVPGLTTKNGAQYLCTLLSEFETLGYHVTWDLVSAADYGVPQKRKRLIIIGHRKHAVWFPQPTHGNGRSMKHVPSGTILKIDCPLGVPPECPVIYAKNPDPRRSPYAGHVYNGGGRPVDLEAPCHTLLASAGGYKTHWIDTLNIAPEYTAHLMAGGAPREGEVPGARRMTLEESALIQTFPEGMWFAGSKSSQYTQVGDAVPPKLGHAMGEALMSQLENSVFDEVKYYQGKRLLPLFKAA